MAFSGDNTGRQNHELNERFGGNPIKILVVDDSTDTRMMVSMRLKNEGYTVYSAGDAFEALSVVESTGLPHLAILDILLPGPDGFDLAENLQKRGRVPIIFLSAVTDVETKVRGLDNYADDYILKPFKLAELLARVRRVLLRVAPLQLATPEQMVDPSLRINFTQQYALVGDERILLTPTENRILNTLFSNRGHVISAENLLSQVWDPSRKGSLESLWVHVRRLRSKIEPDPDNPRYVVTIRGQGYCMPNANQVGSRL